MPEHSETRVEQAKRDSNHLRGTLADELTADLDSFSDQNVHVLTGNLLVGGGQGMTHKRGDTFAQLAEPVAFVSVDQAVEAVRTVVATFRDYGDRTDQDLPSGNLDGRGRGGL